MATGKLRGNWVAGVADTASAESGAPESRTRGVVAAEPVAAAATRCAGDCLAEPPGEAEVRACSASQRRAELMAADMRAECGRLSMQPAGHTASKSQARHVHCFSFHRLLARTSRKQRQLAHLAWSWRLQAA